VTIHSVAAPPDPIAVRLAGARAAGTISRHDRMAERMAILHDLLHDPTVPVTTLDILSGHELGGPVDRDRTVGLRLVRPHVAPDTAERGDEGASPQEGVEPAIDPRIRARRIAVRRAPGRRRLWGLLAAAAIVGTVAVAWVVTRTPLLDVDRIAVVGAERTPADDVVAASGIHAGQPLVDVDSGAAAAAIDDLPWVSSAEVERHWPGTVVVRVEERLPVAIAPAEEGGWAVLAADGRAMEIVPDPVPGLVPLVDVPPVVAKAELEPETAAALAVARLVPASLAGRVVGVGPGPGGDVELRLDPVGVVRLGDGGDLDAKLVAADAVLAQAPTNCIAVIDVSVPGSPVLTQRPECG
jgi:cell division protein FtsQ